MKVRDSSAEALIEAELEPPPVLTERTAAGGSPDVRLMLGKHNRVVVHKPSVQRLTDPVDPSSVTALALPWADSQFLVVATTIGCLPDPDCRFTWLRVELKVALPAIALNGLRHTHVHGRRVRRQQSWD